MLEGQSVLISLRFQHYVRLYRQLHEYVYPSREFVYIYTEKFCMLHLFENCTI